MKYSSLLAQRTAMMTRSTVREFLRHASRPGVISFAGGLPAPELFPLEALRDATETVLARYGSKALQYGQTEGVPELRAYLAEKFHTTSEHVLITTGAQQALDVVGRVMLDPGETVLVENPTYLSLLSAWRPLGVHFTGIKIDETGLDLEELDRNSANTKLLYCMPNFQNPTGATMSLHKREQLARKGLFLVEDDAYAGLRYDDNAWPSLYELTGGNSVYVGTFSKTLAPGFRLGWIVGPAELVDMFVCAKQAMDLQTSTLNQYLALQMIEDGVLEQQIPILCAEYKKRRDAMLAALRKTMPPGVTWTIPVGGMFLFLVLPPEINGEQVSRAALKNDVLVVPGEPFHVTGGHNSLRLNFSNSNVSQIDSGIERLASVLLKQLGT